MNLSLALQYARPGEEWILDGDDYTGLTWLSDTPKPTKKQLTDAYPLAVAAKETEAAAREASRQSAINKLTALGLDSLEVQAIIGSI